MKKYRITIMLIGLLFLSVGSFAQSDLIVTKQNIWLNEYEECLGNESDGRVTFDASNGDIFPIDIYVIEAPSNNCWGWAIGEEPVLCLVEDVSEGIVSMSCVNECYGKYCFRAARADGCEIELCRTIQYCKRANSPRGIWCLTNDDIIIHAKEFEDNKTAIYASGYSYFIEPGNEIGSDYTFYAKISSRVFDALSKKMDEQMDAVFMEIQEKGYSVYEIEEQKELKTTADYSFKFNESGDLVWVVYNGSRKIAVETAERRNSQLQHHANVVAVFPNPFEDKINIEVDSRLEQYIYVSLIDMVGKVVTQEKYIVINGQNSLVMDVANLMPRSVYALLITSENGLNYSRKIIHDKK